MGFVVLPASIPDIRKCYDVYFKAFEGSFITRILFPFDVNSEEFRAGHTAHTLDYWHKDTLQYTCKCIDTDTDEIVGMALWDVHWKERTEKSNKPAVDWLQGEQKQRCEDLIVPFWEIKEDLIGPSKHVYCHIVAVDPKYQGKGIGTMLTQWGVDVAEQLQVPMYLEASGEPSVAVYRKVGFQLLERTLHISAEMMGTEQGANAPLMARMPSSAGDLSFEDWVKQGRPELGKPKP